MKRCFRCRISYPNSVGDKCPSCHKGMLTFHPSNFQFDEDWIEKLNQLPQVDATPIPVYTHKKNHQKFASNLDLIKHGYRNMAVGKLIEGADSKNNDEVGVYELAMELKKIGMWWIKPVQTELELDDVYSLLGGSDGKEEEAE